MFMKDENLFSRKLNNFSDADIEKIAETVPALDKQAKKRILKKCMNKMTDTDFEAENTVSGTEKYSRPRIIQYIPTAVACLLAVIGISGVILINRNTGTPPDDMQSAVQYTSITTTDKTVSSSGTVNTVTTTVMNTKKIIIVTETTDKIQQVTESVTDIVTETADKVQQVEESTTEAVTEVPATENKSFAGEYGDKMEIDYSSGSKLIIKETGDNSYNIYVGFFRVAGFTDCIGSVTDGVLNFYAPCELYGETVFAGEIRLNDDGCILKITESENNPIGIDSSCGTQYYKIQ